MGILAKKHSAQSKRSGLPYTGQAAAPTICAVWKIRIQSGLISISVTFTIDEFFSYMVHYRGQ